MKAIMKELRWMELPKGCRRTSTSIELPVPCDTLFDESLKNTLRMLAVSDEDFTFSFSSPVTPVRTRCGLTVYQDPNDWLWISVNLNEDGETVLSSCVSVHGHRDYVEFPANTTAGTVIGWELRRKGENLEVHCTCGGPDRRPVRSFSLPSSKGSVSFGLFAGNGSEKKLLMEFSSLRYRSEGKSSTTPLEPANASNATTALL